MRTETHKELIRWANAQRGRPFAWGATDCATLAAEAAHIAGADRLVPTYQDEAGALAEMQSKPVSEWLLDAGCRHVDPRMARDGDVLVVPDPPWPETYYVVFGRYALTAAPAHGVGYVRASDVIARATTALRVR